MGLCYTSCMISVVFLVASLYLMYAVDKEALQAPFLSTLTAQQLAKYKKIVEERKNIYFQGYGIGFILSALVLVLYMLNGVKINRWMVACLTASTTFLTTYLYYTVTPKTDHIILHLDSKIQREEWLRIYRGFQVNYHMGFVFGILAVFFMTTMMCK